MGGKILDYEAKDILNMGREEGLKEGCKDTLKQMIKKKLAKGRDAETIAEELEADITMIQKLIDEIGKEK